MNDKVILSFRPDQRVKISGIHLSDLVSFIEKRDVFKVRITSENEIPNPLPENYLLISSIDFLEN